MSELCEDPVIIEKIKKLIYSLMKDNIDVKLNVIDDYVRVYEKETFALTIYDDFFNMQDRSPIGIAVLPATMRNSNIMSLSETVKEYDFRVQDFTDVITDIKLYNKIGK